MKIGSSMLIGVLFLISLLWTSYFPSPVAAEPDVFIEGRVVDVSSGEAVAIPDIKIIVGRGSYSTSWTGIGGGISTTVKKEITSNSKGKFTVKLSGSGEIIAFWPQLDKEDYFSVGVKSKKPHYSRVSTLYPSKTIKYVNTITGFVDGENVTVDVELWSAGYIVYHVVDVHTGDKTRCIASYSLGEQFVDRYVSEHGTNILKIPINTEVEISFTPLGPYFKLKKSFKLSEKGVRRNFSLHTFSLRKIADYMAKRGEWLSAEKIKVKLFVKKESISKGEISPDFIDNINEMMKWFKDHVAFDYVEAVREEDVPAKCLERYKWNYFKTFIDINGVKNGTYTLYDPVNKRRTLNFNGLFEDTMTVLLQKTKRRYNELVSDLLREMCLKEFPGGPETAQIAEKAKATISEAKLIVNRIKEISNINVKPIQKLIQEAEESLMEMNKSLSSLDMDSAREEAEAANLKAEQAVQDAHGTLKTVEEEKKAGEERNRNIMQGFIAFIAVLITVIVVRKTIKHARGK